MKTPIPTAQVISFAWRHVVDNPGFYALPRPIHYETPLCPKEGPRAVIVFGKEVPWTLKAAQSVQRAVQDWSGAKLEIADDRTITSEETWLQRNAYRKTPLIVLGNARDNRVMHALGTRYLLQSNRSRPGGDRFIIRTVFEPFVADVNYIVLEASGEAGMDGAVEKFRELLKTFPKDAAAAIPYTRLMAGVEDKWEVEDCSWKPPAEMAGYLDRSVTELARAFKGEPVRAGDDFGKAGLGSEIYWHVLGGIPGRSGAVTLTFDAGTQRAMAAMYLLGYRAVGGRTHTPYDHYGAMTSIIGLRCFLQAGILNEKEVNEFESCMALSGAYPGEYNYDHIGSNTGAINAWGGRHSMACLLVTLHTLDYVSNHCRMDERTRKEIERRYEGARRATAQYVRSFRNNDETSCLGEDTLLQFYSVLHQGLMENVRNGSLRRSADFYMLTSDNLFIEGSSPFHGCYVGLAGFSSEPGWQTSDMVGRGLIDAAAFYYDDAQYRWLAGNWGGTKWSVAANVLGMHLDNDGKTVKPTMYDGVRVLPYDERLYGVLAKGFMHRRWEIDLRLPPEPFEKAIDRAAFRDGLDPQDAYLFLATSQDIKRGYPAQNNSIARYTDLGEIWLYTNTTGNTAWARSVVSISNGKSYLARAACVLEALANLGEVSAISSKEQGVAGSDWTRTIVHWRGHYFVVLDRMEAVQDDEFAFVCRWRSLQPAYLEQGVWCATAPSGSRMRIQNTEGVFQTAEHWECDGSARPYVLQQFKQARLAKGQSENYQNLLFVWGKQRPDDFEARRVNADAMLVKGRTAAGGHLALIGTRGQMPLADFETDAAVYDVMGNRLHLAAVTVLKAKTAELFWAQKPVNLLLDCKTGEGEIELIGDESVKVRLQGQQAPSLVLPGRHPIKLTNLAVLPKPEVEMEKLWRNSKEASAVAAQSMPGGKELLGTVTASASLQRPLRQLNRFEISSTPPLRKGGLPYSAGSCATEGPWNCQNTENLEIKLNLPEPTVVSCLRLVTITKMVNFYGIGSKGYGLPHYQPDDFKFSLMLSNDDFRQDIRKIDAPQVKFEETPAISVGHWTMSRLPTWRVEIGEEAKQIKLLPRATTKERAALHFTDLEIYAVENVNELTAQAFAADINGDGDNELVVGTSQKEVAAYDSNGKRLWLKNYWPGEVLTMSVADLEEDGKAEVLVCLTSEELHRVNGDGTERPVADINKAQLETFDGKAGGGNVTTIGVWALNGAKDKEVLLWAEPLFRVLPDGKVKVELGKIGHPQGAGRLVNLYPNEPEVLVTIDENTVALWSARHDEMGGYTRLGVKPPAGPGSGENRGLGWVRQVNLPGFKGFLAAMEGCVAWYPISSFLPGSKEEGWGFNTGGVPAVAAMAEDINCDGVPEVFLARLDGFVNVFRLADGSPLGLLKTGEPILGMAVLKGKDGKPRLAVGTKFAVHLFGPDLKPIGRQAISSVAFAGPGGKERDRVYVVDAGGKVTVLVME